MNLSRAYGLANEANPLNDYITVEASPQNMIILEVNNSNPTNGCNEED